jgi:hypothetical protein
MRNMNKRMMLYAMALSTIAAVDLAAQPVAAEKLRFTPIHKTGERYCLTALLKESHWRTSPQFHSEMMATAKVATADLDGARRKAYFYIFDGDGWCGTIGCPLLIGEVRLGRKCRLLYDGSGFADALREGGGFRPVMEVLRTRDHGYRRLYTPCDTRFDGKQYQKLHEECSRLDIPR